MNKRIRELCTWITTWQNELQVQSIFCGMLTAFGCGSHHVKWCRDEKKIGMTSTNQLSTPAISKQTHARQAWCHVRCLCPYVLGYITKMVKKNSIMYLQEGWRREGTEWFWANEIRGVCFGVWRKATVTAATLSETSAAWWTRSGSANRFLRGTAVVTLAFLFFDRIIRCPRWERRRVGGRAADSRWAQSPD